MTEFGDVMFADVDREGWATAVGHSLVEAARIWVEAVPSSLVTEECWLADDLSLLFTYQLDGAALGGRFADLHLCPLTGFPLYWVQRGVSYSASGYATDIFNGVPVAVGVPEIKWTGPDGRRWWGAVPEQGWSAVVTGPRSVSIR